MSYRRRAARFVGTFGVVVAPGVLAVRQPMVREISAARRAIDASGFRGTVLVYNLKRNTWSAGHAERARLRLIPASTFKILNALVSLEAGVVANEQSVIPWDSVVRDRPELNRDLDLQTAFRLSAVPHFQSLARQVGEPLMQRYVDVVGYGNRKLTGGIDQFWLTGGLRISPQEQIEFLVRLYRDQLPFSTRVTDIVKRIMISDETASHTTRSKTGWAILPGGKNVGWWVGWVEHGDDAWFFATALEATRPDSTFGLAREALTRQVLTIVGAL